MSKRLEYFFFFLLSFNLCYFLLNLFYIGMASQMAQMIKAHSAGDANLIPGLGFPRRRDCQPNSVFWPGESYGQRSLAGYST